MRRAVTFIVRAVNERIPVFGCINSIYRQNNKSFEVVVITDIEGLPGELKEKYKGIRVIEVKEKKDYVKASNDLIRTLETEYFVYTNSDTVYTPNAVDEILSGDDDSVIFNISRILKKGFKALYPTDEEFTFESYIYAGIHIWNNAFRTQFVVGNGIFIKKLGYFDQLIYLLEIYSLAKNIRMVDYVLACRAKIVKPKPVSYGNFCQNRKLLKKIVRRFNAKGMHSVAKKVVADIVFDNINVYYEEKNILRKIVIKHRIKKFICI